jgi:preprotein translocase subunit SecB
MTDNKPAEQQFALQRIYVKDLSFESPLGVDLFQLKLAPQINMDMNTRFSKISDDQYEVVLGVTVTAKQDDKTAFVVEVQQAGLFQCAGIEGEGLDRVLRSFCPGILFPYMREAIDNLVVRGGLPPLQLAPVNFDALYQQALAQQAAQQATKN